MGTIETKIYTFNELSEDAKEKAIQKWRENSYEFDWVDDYLESIKKGLDHFDCELIDYSIDPLNAYCSSFKIKFNHSFNAQEMKSLRFWKYIQNNYSSYFCKYQKKFRNTFEGNCPFTGFCSDEYFLDEIREFLKKPYDYMNLYDLMRLCVDSTLSALQSDCEHQLSDEYISEQLSDGYEFTENGKLI